MFEDKTLVCRECRLQNSCSLPRSSSSMLTRVSRMSPAAAPLAVLPAVRPMVRIGADRPMFDVVCDGCGRPTQVPFQPRGDRPVYCRECFEKQRASRY